MTASIINYCIIGIFASGKTSLAASFVKNKKSVTNESTIGASFIVNYTQTIGGCAIRINIWDTAGQERYRAITNAYYRGAVGALMLYDISRNSTFDNVEKWLKEL